jgi:hypothetical protein
MRFGKTGIALLAAAALVGSWLSTGRAAVPLIPSTPQYSEPSQIVGTLNFLINQINSLITPQTMATFNNNRNLLDNGAMSVSQRGTGTQTCALNGAAITSAAYAADRWGCEVNVGSGAGQLTTISATPSPPTGFANSIKLVRNSGALTQPQCVYQEVPTYKATTMQGQNVVFSVNIQALAGLAADQGASTQTANLLIITGTGSDQGLGTWTASPALTPAWTGVATAVNTSVALPVTPAWTRYSTTAAIGSTVTEIAVAVCFTPTATGAGTTDGIALTGGQLEQGTVASTYEFRPPSGELAELQRYYWQINDNVANTVPITMCHATTTSAVVCVHQFPVTMRAAPTATASASTAFGDTATAGAPTACTAFSVVASSTSVQTGKTTCTTGATTTAGGASQLVGANTGANLNFSADF